MPDLLPNTSKLELLARKIKQQQGQQNGIKLPTIRTMLISKRAASFIISGTFPTLFPIGRANFNLLRSYLVNLTTFAKYILKYKDGRFRRYPRF